MRLLIDNLATEDNTTVNGVSDSFPKENMYNNTLIEKTYFDDYIDIDLGSATTIDSIGLNSSSSDTFIIQANSSEDWVSPPYEETITNEVTFIDETYRYWRIIIDGYIEAYGITYSSGTDMNLTSPDNNYDTPSNYMLIEDVGGDCVLHMGSLKWNASSPLSVSATWPNSTPSTSYGSIFFRAISSTNWSTVSSSSNNGLQTFTLPKLADGDSLGGYFEYYFHSSAWNYAFVGGTDDIVIAQNGSVYKGAIVSGVYTNLVVRWDGQIGPAGSATPDVTEDITRVINSLTSKINYFYLGEYMEINYMEPGSESSANTTDAANRSSMGVVSITPGIFYQSQSFIFPIATEDEYDLFNDWYQTADRSNAHYIVPFQDDTPIESIYGVVTDFPAPTRDKLNYNFRFNFSEVK